jgi:SPP1 family predicted phage head-tail adaptor
MVTGMRAGELRDRVTLQSVSPDASAQSGQGEPEFQDAIGLWAVVQPASGGESLQAGAVVSQVAYAVEIRAIGNVTAGMRLLWRPYRETTAKTLEIHAVIPHPTMTDRLVLHCGVTE